MSMQHPSLAAFKQVQADPSLLQRDADLLAEFAAAPWLLPPRTPALPYAGVHDLDRLAALRAVPAGNHSRTITLLTFSSPYAVMMQNALYSLVKFGGVRNYIIATMDPADLAACAALNLPCADATAFLPEPLQGGADAGLPGSHDYLVICWLRPILVSHLLQQGYAVFSTDSDIVFTAKPVWDSYLAFIQEAHADAAFQSEGAILNGGSYVVLPTPAATAFVQQWVAMAPRMLQERNHDQDGLGFMQRAFAVCGTPGECAKQRQQAGGEQRMLIRKFAPNYLAYIDNEPCGLAEETDLPLIDPCDWAVMFLHPVCLDYAGKLEFFKRQGFWFLEDASCAILTAPADQVAACHPLRWSKPLTEAPLYSCPEYSLGLAHSQPARQPPAH